MAGIEALPNHEEYKERDSEGGHAKKKRRAKAILPVGCERPGKKKQGKAAGYKYETDHCSC
jgi:hypothetical protein